MPRFKVELERRICRPGEWNRNPFLAPLPAPGATHEMSIRAWEFDAEDELDVRRLLAEAQEAGIANVSGGYRLRSIAIIPDLTLAERLAHRDGESPSTVSTSAGEGQ